MWNKLITSIFILSVFLLPFQSDAKITETHCIADILSEADQDTLVFFDIDDTLINTTSMLGNSPWWYYFTSKVSKANLQQAMVPQIYAVIQKILHEVPIGLIEPCASDIVGTLQARGILTLALTARSKTADYMPAADMKTHHHLNSVGIDFTRTPLPKNVEGEVAGFFSYGIIFTHYQEKGPFLKTFLKNMGLHPSKIIFVDDNAIQMKSVEKAVESMGISFAGYRYGRLDHFHAKFDPLIANIQLEALVNDSRVLTDEEAQHIARANPGRNPDYFMDHLIHFWSEK